MGLFSYLVFCELPKSMIWCCTLIWGNSQSSLIQMALLFLFFLAFLLHLCFAFSCGCPTIPGYYVLFVSVFFFSLWFSLVSIGIYSSSEILPSAAVQCTNEPIKGILHFWCCIFWFLAFLVDSLLEFPPLYFHYPSVLACCLLFPLMPLTY